MVYKKVLRVWTSGRRVLVRERNVKIESFFRLVVLYLSVSNNTALTGHYTTPIRPTQIGFCGRKTLFETMISGSRIQRPSIVFEEFRFKMSVFIRYVSTGGKTGQKRLRFYVQTVIHGFKVRKQLYIIINITTWTEKQYPVDSFHFTVHT